LEDRLHTGADGAFWRAVDETLERQVGVRVISPGHPFAADVVDAARRAALVDDPRLTRILDVGESDGTTYIVTEHVQGRVFEDVLRTGPLPAETVRRLVGECAQALDRAGTRGLHHLRLSPTSILVLPDGSVMTESAAILIHLGLSHPEAGLLPTDTAARAQAIRGLVFIAANCYSNVSISDYPERWISDCTEDDPLRERVRQGARAQLKVADTRAAAQHRVLRAAQRAFAAGETDRLELTLAELQAGSADLARQDAFARLQQAAGEVEDAMQRPIADRPARDGREEAP